MIRRLLRPAQRAGLRVHGLLARPAVGHPPEGHSPGDRPSLASLASLGTRLGQIESSLAEGLLPFWTRHTWDESDGGFVTLVDRAGHPTGSRDKELRRQARMTWMLAAAHRHGLSGHGYLELAARGAAFLTTRMWDARHGGFWQRVSPDGRSMDARKATADQAFAVHALAEYALASGDRDFLTRAGSALDGLLAGAADGAGGLREHWTPDEGPADGNPPEPWLLAVHCHLLAALTTLAPATEEPRHTIALRRTRDLLRDLAIDRRLGCAFDRFDESGRPRAGPGHVLVTTYGHNVQLAWMLLDATEALGEPRESMRRDVLGLLDHALAFGFDWRRGGLAAYGPPEGHVTHAMYMSRRRLHKIRWPQAELLAALATAYRWTGESRYRAALDRQLDWLWRHQIDHATGDWFDVTSWRRGRPIHGTGTPTDPFHDARAVMRASRELRATEGRP